MKGLCASVWLCDCLLGRRALLAAKAADESLCPSPWGDFVAAAAAGQVMELIISPSSREKWDRDCWVLANAAFANCPES